MRKLQAYFDSMCEARTAAAALSEAGCGNAHLDLAGALDYEYSREISSLERDHLEDGGSDHLWSLMLDLWTRGLNDKKPVARAPGIVYQAQEDCEEGELKISTRLVLKLPEDDTGKTSEKAAGIIRENGGRIFPPAVI